MYPRHPQYVRTMMVRLVFGELFWSSCENPQCIYPLHPQCMRAMMVRLFGSSCRVQPGYFGILRRWYNDVGKGHRKWVVNVGKNWDNVLENVRWSYWVSSLVTFDHGLDDRGVQGLRCHPQFVGERDQAVDPLHEKLHRNYPQYCRPRFDEVVARCCNEEA
ncbi:hypothetical protein LguiA_018164 [Lonicera macranthoides]